MAKSENTHHPVVDDETGFYEIYCPDTPTNPWLLIGRMRMAVFNLSLNLKKMNCNRVIFSVVNPSSGACTWWLKGQ